MIRIDTKRVVSSLKTIESVAMISRVASTNLIARRVMSECIDNELFLPQAIIIAEEQLAGRGRNERSWSSPRGKGIYATTILTRPASELPAVPFAMANIVVTYLREVFAIDARIKWPNDVLVDGRKIAGILIEARIQDDRAFLLIGTGINVEPVHDDLRPNAVSITEVTGRDFRGIDDATVAFIEHVDEQVSLPFDRAAVLAQWRGFSIHQPGDPVRCVIGERTVSGAWGGIDDDGRALLIDGTQTVAISAGDLILG